MCKPNICKTISSVNQNKPNVNFSPPYANHKILVIPKSFTKSLRVTAYFYGLITCPTFLVQSVEVTFLGEKKVYMVYTGLHRFTSVCPPMYAFIQLSNHTSCPIRPNQPCDAGESQLRAGSSPSEQLPFCHQSSQLTDHLRR